MENLLLAPWGSLDLVLLVVRVALGVCFIVHGMGKLGIVGPGNMQGFTGWLESLGVPAPALQARMAMATELVGGLFLTLGLFARPAALLLMFTMIVASKIGHKGGGYLITNDPPGAEYAINLALLMFMYAMIGPGTYSLDYMFWGN